MDSQAPKISIPFTKQEWTVIFNLITRGREYPLGTALIVLPIVAEIEKVVAVDTNIEKPEQIQAPVATAEVPEATPDQRKKLGLPATNHVLTPKEFADKGNK